MPESWDLHEGRFIREEAKTSAADGLYIDSSTVPAGKVWTVIECSIGPSVAETQEVAFLLISRSTYQYAVSIPESVALSTLIQFPLVTMGMELKLFPGDKIRGRRAAATAGSTISMNVRYIETDLPPYDYVEPQERKRITAARHSIGKAISGGVGGGAVVPPVPPGRGGGRGGSEPY